MREHLEPCIGCGGLFPVIDGPTHRYMLCSPGCWACYGEVLAREYDDVLYWRVHGMTVDTYAVQHPGDGSPQAVRSVALHLISLCAVLERHFEPQETVALLRTAARREHVYHALAPPVSMGSITIRDVHAATNAEEHAAAVRAWAESAWAAWSAHHGVVHEWLERCVESRT